MSDSESLPEMVGRLGEDLTTLLDTKLSLLKIEIKEDLSAYTSYVVMMAVGGVIATVGFALFNVAIAFFISTIFQSADLSEPVRYGLGFVITALIYLVIGTIIIMKNKDRLARRDPAPARTIRELEKDKRWIEKEL
jgi:uncharacterized membrane protein YqjE